MKKLLIGILIGFVLSVPTTIFADDVISVIGKKIETEVGVTILGQKLDKKAPLLDGTTYVPIRAVTEKLNLAADFVNGEVIISNPTREKAELLFKITEKKRHIDEIKSNIVINNGMIKDLEKRIVDEVGKTDYLTGLEPTTTLKIRKEMGLELVVELAKLESELAELEKQQ